MHQILLSAKRTLPFAAFRATLNVSLFLCLTGMCTRAFAQKQIIYVSEFGRGQDSGLSWDQAINSVEQAMNKVESGDEIWVQAGTHPISQFSTNGLKLKEGVAMYGGFAGTESSLAERDLSNPENVSTIAGSGKEYTIYNKGNNLTAATILDGFTISGGTVAGILNEGASPTMSNLVVAGNGSTEQQNFFPDPEKLAGGISNVQSSARYVNVAVHDNQGFTAIADEGSSATYVNCLVYRNSVFQSHVVCNSSASFFINCTIADESTQLLFQGNGFFVDGTVVPKIYNSIVNGQSMGISSVVEPDVQNSIVFARLTFEGSFIYLNPLNDIFVDPGTGDYSPIPCSPAVNTGFDYFQPGQTPDISAYTRDLRGVSVYSESIVDKGALQFSGATRVLALDDDVASGTASGNLVLTTTTDCRLLAIVAPNGAAPLNGEVNAKVWVAGTQPAEFVKRHYEITPASNAANATARVTLFFTQEEFDDFNAVNSIKLPLNAADAENYKSNLRIEKRGGVSSSDTGVPGSYSGAISTFKPSEANGSVAWNAVASRWEVSFNVTGFSGFFVKTSQSPLPLNLISFTASKETGSNLLQWSTTSEVNTDQFEVQTSADAKRFIKLATINAGGSGDHRYSYNDQNPSSRTVYYRLKMSDLDGTFTYSKTISLSGNVDLASIYPNPAREAVTIRVNNALLKTTADLYDLSGRRIQSIVITNNQQQIDTKALSSGMYILRFADGTAETFVRE
ncbi:T9SS type A sorting domain-containing protein [Dyadobacter sp.]|uniref:T9SS type A sorting domain-containing protein n=1 Tax=Dyadobacter sp. TaxID=1914288 RepID=UPI003F6FF462